MTPLEFSEEQKHYLSGFTAGSGIARTLANLTAFPAGNTLAAPAPALAGPERPARPEDVHLAAQDRFLAEGKKLTHEDNAKRKKHGLDAWDDIVASSAEGKFPAGTDVFLYKFHGLFYVAPAQNAFMCRMRVPGGIMTAHQFAGVAEIADRCAGGYADITTRANLQLREIAPTNAADTVSGLLDLGIITRGAGADNIRNLTASPTAGIDPQELFDVRPLVKQLHHHIVNHRELYGLPRKFNIAFDSGGTVSTLEDTNDIGFAAVRVSGDDKSVPPGVYFRMQLGGITGHKDFARDTGLMLTPEQCIPVAVAALRVFIEHGDRTDRKKARLKYVLDRHGIAWYLDEMQKHLPFPLPKAPLDMCEPRPQSIKHAHAGVHPQKQPGFNYVGVVVPAGRMRSDQMRGLAAIADAHGSGTIRLTVWQNVLISDVPDAEVEAVKREVEALGLTTSPTSIRAGLVACTGSAGCKFGMSNTKLHALTIAGHVEATLGDTLNSPVNVHLTGCPNSCAQHYIGDIGLVGVKVAGESENDEPVEGYHLVIGGGYGADQAIAREFLRDVKATDAPAVVERILKGYLDRRCSPEETFVQFARRHSTEELRAMTHSDSLAVS